MAKEIIFNAEARKQIKEGMDVVAKAVGVTIGPFGRNVALEKSYGAPTITNDGVSIAKDIELKDQFKNLGVEMLKEVANKTNELAGDGTSTSVVLTHALVEEGIKQIDKGINALSIKRGMDIAHKLAEKELLLAKRDVKTDEDIVHIASVSAESKEFGKIIAETVKKVGDKGVVTVEESQSFGIESEVVEGLEIENGYISPYMMTNTERFEAEYKDVPVLITDKTISSVKEILPFLEKVTQSGNKNLVIFAENIEGEALTTFVLNKLRGNFNVLAVKTPGFGDQKKAILEDMATTIGAQVVSEEKGMNFNEIDTGVLGSASRIVSKKDKTIIVGNSNFKKDVEARIKILEKELETLEHKYEKDKLEERIAKLSGGVAVIKVGAATESEIKYLKLKIEDAVNATKAALEEGVIAGGGSTFTHIAKKLRESDTSFDNEYEKKGFNIVVDSLEAPLTKIAENTLGEGEGKAIVREVQKNNSLFGYDALKKEFVKDMFSVGIIDPVKVARGALQNSVSAAGIFLTTEVAIVNEKTEENPNQMNPGLGGGMPGF